MKKKSSDLFVECLEQEGVKYIFGISGEEIIDLLEAIRKSKIKFILTRHEQGAAFMADVWGRLTGQSGVCLSTLGPGAANLVTGVADANLDRAPLVAITGQGGLERIHKESHQYIDIVNMFKPITKWNARVEKAATIPEIVRKAFKISQAEKPGATHIELPEDIVQEEVSANALKIHQVNSPAPDEKFINSAVEIINNAKYPLILSGNGVIRDRSAFQLLELSKKGGIPVTETFMGKGSIPFDYEYSLLCIGLQMKDYAGCGFDKADVIIAVGYDLVEYSPSHWNPNKNKKIIHIDFTPSEIDEYYQTEVDIVGDIKSSLEELTKKISPRIKQDFTIHLREFVLKEIKQYSNDLSFPVKPQKLIFDLREVLNHDDILISDVGAHKIWLARLFPTYKPNTVIISNGFASMGIALPGAIAAKLVYPEKNVCAVCGDGGFLMNVQELETAVRLGLNFLVVIFEDLISPTISTSV
ncbi:MAG: acetolactate synthase large subunit [Cyanobacteria bacterium]|nr:acetolactate synthase large subunit [Cyanobacteriota bacterium]